MMAIAPWPKTRPSLPTKVQRDFKGVNRLDAFSIPDDMATDMQNVTSINYPALSVRPGFSLVGSAFAGAVYGLGIWKQTEIEAISGGAWYKYNGSSWVSLKTGLNATAQWSFANYKGSFSGINLIGANGVDAPQTYDGTTVSNLANAPAGANFVETFMERVWMAKNSDIYGCASGNATNWSTFAGNDSDPYNKTVESPDGENIIGLKAGNNHLTIFKPNSIHELFGYVPSDFRTLPVTYKVGAVSNQAITVCEGVMYFVHQTGLYKYSGGTLPDREWSRPIQDYMNRINPAQISKCCAGTNGKIVYIAIPLDTATDPDTIIEYNTEFGTFCVWKGFSPYCMATMVGTIYFGSTTGQVRQIGGSTSDNGTPISWYWNSKPFSATSLAQRTKWKRAWLTANVPTGSTMAVGLSKTDSANDFTVVQNAPVSNANAATRVIIPTTTVANANYIRYQLSGTGPARIEEFAWEVEQLPIV